MAAGLNRTYLTLGGYVEVQRFGLLYFMVTFSVYVFIVCSNFTIVSLICKHKRLHEPMFVFIAALLLNSALYGTVIYPKLLVDVLSERQVIQYSACFLQLFLYYTCWGSEFFLLTVMAYDRYVSICRPLKYPTIMTRNTVIVFLVLSWFLPACQISVALILNANSRVCRLTVQGIFCNNSVYSIYCVRSPVLSVYGMVSLVCTGLFPMLFILVSYIRILRICYRSSTEVKAKAAHTCLPHLLVLISFSCLCTYDVVVARLESDLSKTARLIMTLQSVLYHPLLNPIIYGLKMKEISKLLRRLFCQRKAGRRAVKQR